MISAFGVDHGEVAKAAHPMAVLDAANDGVGNLGRKRTTARPVPPAQARKIKSDISALADQGENDVSKAYRRRADVSKSMAGPMLIGNSNTEEVSKAKTFIPLKSVGRPSANVPSVEHTRTVTVPKIRGALAPLKADMLRAAKK